MPIVERPDEKHRTDAESTNRQLLSEVYVASNRLRKTIEREEADTGEKEGCGNQYDIGPEKVGETTSHRDGVSKSFP